MKKITYLLLIFACLALQMSAQVVPAEGSKLCYRIIGFSFPEQANTVKYSLQIARGNLSTDATFEKNIIATLTCSRNRKIAEVPSFGNEYTWRTIAVKNSNMQTKSVLHHFSVKVTPDVDSSISRLRIIKNAEKYKDCYVFIDGNRALYDMNGKPVWFLPGTDLKSNQDAYPRDLKITPQGSITFLTGDQPYEITYDGSILWHVNTKKQVPFHHEFTRLNNGHYMGLIYEDITGHVPPFYEDSIIQDVYDSSGYYKSRLSCSIVELDEKMNLIWYWSGLNYINNSDMRVRKFADFANADHDLHENSFFFDETNKLVYVSQKGISRIIKIKYPEGDVVNTYGLPYTFGSHTRENPLFSLQHSVMLSQKGYLYLFNNNPFGASHLPTLQMFEEPKTGGNELKKIWEYQCTIEAEYSALKAETFPYGGCVREMPDGSMFAFMGKPYPKIFIVSNDKKELWSAISEKYNPATKKWELFGRTYRASIITRKQLEQLIWNSQKTAQPLL